MKIEKTAKTVNIAIDQALKELDTTIDKIDYKIIQEPSKGFLGIFSKPAKVVVTLKEKNSGSDLKSPIKKKIPKMITEDNFKLDNKNFENNQKNFNENADKIAKYFLKDIFQKMNIDIEINVKLDKKTRLLIELDGKDIGVIIGKRGQTLYSLQYLVNLVINKGEFAYVSVSIDTKDYREKRKQTLENLAINLAKKVKKINKSISLEPMNPYERRIIHSKLQYDKSIKTYSVGQDPFRYVVIAPQ